METAFRGLFALVLGQPIDRTLFLFSRGNDKSVGLRIIDWMVYVQSVQAVELCVFDILK